MQGKRKMHGKQIENLLQLSDQERVEYFVRECAAFEEVWGLTVGPDNWIIVKDEDGDEVFLVWPHHDLAEVCCYEEHKALGAKPQSMSLNAFLEGCIPDMVDRGVYFGVFFSAERRGLAIPGASLKEALESEVESTWE